MSRPAMTNFVLYFVECYWARNSENVVGKKSFSSRDQSLHGRAFDSMGIGYSTSKTCVARDVVM